MMTIMKVNTNPEDLTISTALSQLPNENGEPFVNLFNHGTLEVEMYAPKGHDPQEPHEKDEIYVIACGSGWFVNGEARHRFETGQVLFVPAGVVHRFEDFSADFAAWVIFYGPLGGEKMGGESNDQ